MHDEKRKKGFAATTVTAQRPLSEKRHVGKLKGKKARLTLYRYRDFEST